MGLPKARNVVIGIVVGVLLLVVALALAQDQETLRIRTSVAAQDPGYPAYLARLLGNPLTAGDRAIVHDNGENAFPAMLAAIAGARSRVSFETYIFDEGDVPRRFVEAFEAAAHRGVAVRLVLDSIGAKPMSSADEQRLEAAGVRIGWFNPIASYSIEEANSRTHRKVLAVDGDVAFVGGIGIADHWLHAVDGQKRWRDTQVELHGPVALNVEAGFNENWIETGGVVDPDLTPHSTASGGQASSIVAWSSPEGGANEMKLLYLLAIAAARRSIDIQSPYLITDESSQWSLQEARRRGVTVRFLVEGDITDAKPVKYASRADYEHLLGMGIEIYEYQPAMMHTKAMVIDGILSVAGSANFDNRSLELNDELNVAVFDRGLAARLTDDFNRDATESKKLNLEEWRKRSRYEKTRDWLWSYFGEIF